MINKKIKKYLIIFGVFMVFVIGVMVGEKQARNKLEYYYHSNILRAQQEALIEIIEIGYPKQERKSKKKEYFSSIKDVDECISNYYSPIGRKNCINIMKEAQNKIEKNKINIINNNFHKNQ